MSYQMHGISSPPPTPPPRAPAGINPRTRAHIALRRDELREALEREEYGEDRQDFWETFYARMTAVLMAPQGTSLREMREILTGGLESAEFAERHFRHLHRDSRSRAPRGNTQGNAQDNSNGPGNSVYNPFTANPHRPGRHFPFDVGPDQRNEFSLMSRPYRPAREIPISSRDACRCFYHTFEHAPPHMAEAILGTRLHRYRVEYRHYQRRRALGEVGAFSSSADRQLVEMREARALAGLDVSAYDVEIVRRVLLNPGAWGALGKEMTRRGYVDEVIEQGENYVLY